MGAKFDAQKGAGRGHKTEAKTMGENPGKTLRNPKNCEKGENNGFLKTFGADFGKGERRS